MHETESTTTTYSRKHENYKQVITQAEAIIDEQVGLIANISNLMAVLKSGLGFFWVGCYFVKDTELVLGPFQGPPACTRIALGKGVCGSAWEKKKVIIVDDVSKFTGHIACNPESKSEIVIPAYDKNGEVFMVLDVDSNHLTDFDETDNKYLQYIVSLIERLADK